MWAIIWFIGVPILLGIWGLILLHNELKHSSDVDSDEGDEDEFSGEE
jgi:hypothetical protein